MTVMNPGIISVPLQNGATVTGCFVRYEPASLLFETAEGKARVPFDLIPSDLQECFPEEPIVCLGKVCDAVERSWNAWNSALRTYDEAVDRLEKAVIALRAERDALHAENAALRRELEGEP